MRTKFVYLTFFFLYASIGMLWGQRFNKVKINDSMYYVRDTILVKRINHQDSIYVAYNEYDQEGGNSLMITVFHNRRSYYHNFLSCDDCLGRGTAGSTYGGHKANGDEVIFVQDYFNSRDSVYIDFLHAVPTLEKIIRRSYRNEPLRGPDDAGNFIFSVKKKKSVPISNIHLPADKDDPEIANLFFIKPIKWKKISGR